MCDVNNFHLYAVWFLPARCTQCGIQMKHGKPLMKEEYYKDKRTDYTD